MPRRDPFDRLKGVHIAPSSSDQAGQPDQPRPASVLDDLRVAERKKRGRQYERSNPTVSFRGIPTDINEQIVALAEEQRVMAGEIVDILLDFGLTCVERGTLPLEPRPKATRMTLFPLSNSWQRRQGWSEGNLNPVPQPIPTRKTRKEQKIFAPWKSVVSYRGVGKEMADALRRLADKKHVPVGEVATVLLKHGLEAYKAGRIRFNPQPLTARQTLVGWSE